LILHAIKPLGCSEVVRIILISHSRKVIKILALRLKEDFDIMLQLEGLVA